MNTSTSFFFLQVKLNVLFIYLFILLCLQTQDNSCAWQQDDSRVKNRTSTNPAFFLDIMKHFLIASCNDQFLPVLYIKQSIALCFLLVYSVIAFSSMMKEVKHVEVLLFVFYRSGF